MILNSKELIKGRYRHFKGGIYEVICIAKNTETLADEVVYRDVTTPELIWVRPLEMWSESVVHDGKTVLRFSKISDE